MKLVISKYASVAAQPIPQRPPVAGCDATRPNTYVLHEASALTPYVAADKQSDGVDSEDGDRCPVRLRGGGILLACRRWLLEVGVLLFAVVVLL